MRVKEHIIVHSCEDCQNVISNSEGLECQMEITSEPGSQRVTALT